MKVVLVLFDRISKNQNHGFAFMSYRLACELQNTGLLTGMICLGKDEDVEIPSHLTRCMTESYFFKFALRASHLLSRILPTFNARLAEEVLFDRFISSRLNTMAGDILFCSRPLFPKSANRAQKAGMKVWIQASVPHPLTNYELVRSEEKRLGLPCRGAYSDIKRATRLARTIDSADKLITMHPEIGRYPYETYLDSLGPEKVLPLRNFFTVDPISFASVANQRLQNFSESQSITFLHLSHMNLIKGIPYLLEGWRSFKKEPGSEGCRLLLVGRRDENLEKLIVRDYSDLPDIEFMGFVPDLLSCLAGADVFISPSISDNGPGTIIEAMAAAMPVISSKNCGFASLIEDGSEGFTYRFNDPEALVNILLWFAGNRDAIPAMGVRARAKIEDFSTNRYAAELLEKIVSSSQ